MNRIGDTPPSFWNDPSTAWPSSDAVETIRQINQIMFEMDAGVPIDRDKLNELAGHLLTYQNTCQLTPEVAYALNVLAVNLPLLGAPGIPGVSPDNLQEFRSLMGGYIVMAMGDTHGHSVPLPLPANQKLNDAAADISKILTSWINNSSPTQPAGFETQYNQILTDLKNLPSIPSGDPDEDWAILLIHANAGLFNWQDKDLMSFCLDYVNIIE
jgi:hypothetical protein